MNNLDLGRGRRRGYVGRRQIRRGSSDRTGSHYYEGLERLWQVLTILPVMLAGALALPLAVYPVFGVIQEPQVYIPAGTKRVHPMSYLRMPRAARPVEKPAAMRSSLRFTLYVLFTPCINSTGTELRSNTASLTLPGANRLNPRRRRASMATRSTFSSSA
jgi:hypothetical protein